MNVAVDLMEQRDDDAAVLARRNLINARGVEKPHEHVGSDARLFGGRARAHALRGGEEAATLPRGAVVKRRLVPERGEGVLSRERVCAAEPRGGHLEEVAHEALRAGLRWRAGLWLRLRHDRAPPTEDGAADERVDDVVVHVLRLRVNLKQDREDLERVLALVVVELAHVLERLEVPAILDARHLRLLEVPIAHVDRRRAVEAQQQLHALVKEIDRRRGGEVGIRRGGDRWRRLRRRRLRRRAARNALPAQSEDAAPIFLARAPERRDDRTQRIAARVDHAALLDRGEPFTKRFR